jgi:hypothetical protein
MLVDSIPTEETFGPKLSNAISEVSLKVYKSLEFD